jgi:DNA-directed DNA polymerase III PolC
MLRHMKLPRRFVGLHSHSTLSIGDAIGFPQDHMDFARSNGMDSIALTDHGNMNGFSHQFLHGQKLGGAFKPIYGVEAYFVDSLRDWNQLYLETQLAKRRAAEEARREKYKDHLEEMERVIRGGVDDEQAESEDESGGTVVENEQESKRRRSDPIKERSHLVLLAKNSEGLKSLFHLVSRSFKEGFFRYPRIDFQMLEEHAQGNIIALTACVAGTPARRVFDRQSDPEWDNWVPNEDHFEEIQGDLKLLVDRFHQALGPENFYLEMQFNKLGAQHLVNQHLIECSKRTKAPLVVTVDAHYADPEHWRQREIYRLMARATKGLDVTQEGIPQTADELKCQLYPKNAEQVWDSYQETTKDQGWDFYDDDTVREAIERTWTIAHEQIERPEPDTSVKLPRLPKLVDDACTIHVASSDSEEAPVDEEQTAFACLRQAALRGLISRGLHEDPKYVERLKHELRVVRSLKFSKYFLAYAKVMNICSSAMLTGAARGSAGASLLAYVLGITQIDPIRFDLLFERFLTPFKLGFPDIDSDVSDRDKALKLLRGEFGDENVVAISNFNQLQLRSLIKDLGRFENIPFGELNRCTKKIEQETLAEAKKEPGFDAQLWTMTYDEAEEKSPTFRGLMEAHPELEHSIKTLFKQFRTVSRHAGGVLITEHPERSMPLIYGKGRVIQSPWQEGLNWRHLEPFGLLKFDILGLGTLRMFENCIRRILRATKPPGAKVTHREIAEWFYKHLHSDNNSMDDPKVYEHVYWNANYGGVFQFVQPPVQNFVRQMKPRTILDLAVATSIFRPGPLGIKADRAYLANRANPGAIEYAHPVLEEVLGPTSGLIVFQEQLQQIYHKLAGVPLDQTDNIRKAFTKKEKSSKKEQKAKLLKLRGEFVARSVEHSGLSVDDATKLFDDMNKFVAYSFNKAHAVAYAVTSYQCAWLLTYYPDEWISSYVDFSAVDKGKVPGKEAPLSVALGEAKALGYLVGAVDINESTSEYSANKGTLRPSINSLKGIGGPAYRELVSNRPYTGLEELLWNPEDETWRHSKFNKRALSTIIRLGGLESLGVVGPDKPLKNYRQLHYVLVDKFDELKRSCARAKSPRPRELLMQYAQEAQGLEDWTPREKIKHFEELSGTVNIDLVVTPEIRSMFRSVGINSIDRYDPNTNTWAVVRRSTQGTTRTGKPFLKLKVFADSGTEYHCFVWGFQPGRHDIPESYTVIAAKLKQSQFGFSCGYWELESIL